jgi:hypothetical protein
MSMVLKMLFANPLDLLTEAATSALARITGWQPEEKAIVLSVLDPGHPRQRASGQIEKVLRGVLTEGAGGATKHDQPFVVVKLTRPLSLHGEQVDRLVAGPRYHLHSLARLILTGWTANLYRVPAARPAAENPWSLGAPIAIGILKRSSPKP